MATLALCASLLAACGSGGPGGATPASAADSAVVGAEVSTTSSPVISTTGVDDHVVDEIAPPSAIDADATIDLEVNASLGYPRDLQERGRVNLKISRTDDVSLVVLDKRLVADFFLPAPVEVRRSTIPGSRRIVALQTLFGTVQDCEDARPVTAAVELTYMLGDDLTERRASFALTDTAVLDEIRFQDCTVRRLIETTSITLGLPTIVGETLEVDLTILRLDGDDDLAIDSIKGTVLFGASTPFEPGAPERSLSSGADTLTIPLTFDVNRCDSHAVAETTKKFGLDFYFAVNGAESQRVPIDLTPIQPALQTILDQCKARTGQ